MSCPCVVRSYPVERKEHKATALPESHDSEDQWPQTCQLPAHHWGKWFSWRAFFYLFIYSVAFFKYTLFLCFYLILFFFILQIKRINSEDYKKTFEEIVRDIDKMENECIPSVTLSKREVKLHLTILPGIKLKYIIIKKIMKECIMQTFKGYNSFTWSEGKNFFF